MSPIDKLLPRLNKARSVKQSEWRACCPAHDDRNPSLSIEELSDCTLLLHCWAGCSTADIVTAIGLTMRDLFPDGMRCRPRRGPSQQAIQLERAIVEYGRLLMEQGTNLSASDKYRLKLARRRLAKLEGRI